MKKKKDKQVKNDREEEWERRMEAEQTDGVVSCVCVRVRERARERKRECESMCVLLAASIFSFTMSPIRHAWP